MHFFLIQYRTPSSRETFTSSPLLQMCVFPCGQVCVQKHMAVKISPQATHSLSKPRQLIENSRFSSLHIIYNLNSRFPSLLYCLQKLLRHSHHKPEMLMIGSRGEDCILIELFVLISPRASAYAAAQIPGRPLLCCARKKPRERRQLCRVPQMASSVPSVLIQRHHQQQTRDSKPETLLGSSCSISSLTTMLLLYITVSACTTSSSPPRKRKTSLTERITSSLQTRWASAIL